MGKKNRIKIKKQRPISTIGGFSILNGVLSILACLFIFIVCFLSEDKLIQNIQDMNEAVLVLLFLIIICIVIVWGFIKLFLAGITLSGLWIPSILCFVAGALCKSASAHYNNIYSNKGCKTKVIVAIVLWLVSIAFNVGGIFIVRSGIDEFTSGSIFATTVCCAVSGGISLLCVLIAFIDITKKKKLLKIDEHGEIIDETLVTLSSIQNGQPQASNVYNNTYNNGQNDNQTGEWLGGSEDSSNQEDSTTPRLKVGDITPNGRVIGFNVNTGDPIYMPIDKNNQ